MQTQNILLTGATGQLGSHILYELLFQYATRQKQGKIFLLVRSTSKDTATQRIVKLLLHPYRPAYLRSLGIERLLSYIQIIDASLESLTPAVFAALKEEKKLHVIHAAAYTSLSISDDGYERLFQHNYSGVMNLLESVAHVMQKFIFIGSAYATGHIYGLIPNSFKQLRPFSGFRNHYEGIKAKAEDAVITYCNNQGVAWQVLRPTFLCGRMLDAPLYYTPPSNMFSRLSQLFYNAVLSGCGEDTISILANTQTPVNVVPLDYAAKAVVRIFDNDTIRELNIASSTSLTTTALLAAIVVKKAGISCVLTKKLPQHMNRLERIYYNTAGIHLTPYLLMPWHRFDTIQLQRVMHDIPEINMQERFSLLHNKIVQYRATRLGSVI